MKLLIIFVASFVVLCVGQTEYTTQSYYYYSSTEYNKTSTEKPSTQSGVKSTTTEASMCGPNEEYSMCKCRLSDLCWTRILSDRCLRCKPGCRCREGYKRRRRSSPCIPMEECRILGK